MTNKRRHIFILFVLALWMIPFSTHAQYRREHAFSVYGGYGFFKSDFGMRYDWETNISNNATQFGVKAYLNLYPRNMQVVRHFRFYSNLDFIFAHLVHKGKWAEKDSPGGEKLRAMTADPFLAGIGFGTEYWFRDLKNYDFLRYWDRKRINAYVGISLNAYYYQPNVKSSLGNVNNLAEQPYILHPRFVGHIYNNGSFAFAAGLKFGVSVPINYYLQIYWENPFLWFPGDKVDGLDVNDQADKYGDWIYTPVIGLTYIIQ
ncbi:MAG: hypothetical protein GXO24_05685 [Chlorobi bacterium]|nr:hypothetical protein [Chlorobiota bacterium]